MRFRLSMGPYSKWKSRQTLLAMFRLTLFIAARWAMKLAVKLRATFWLMMEFGINTFATLGIFLMKSSFSSMTNMHQVRDYIPNIT